MFADELKKIIKGEVAADEEILKKYSRDASLFEIKPEVVVYPKDAEDVKNLVKFASERENVSLTPRSGGTDMSGGALTESVVIDVTRHLNQVKEVAAQPEMSEPSPRGEAAGRQRRGDGYAVVQPGVYYRDFEKETLKHNLLLPSYPASREICAVGGMVANNSGGEKTLAYGKTEDYVMELKVVLSDGNEYTIKPLSKSELDKKIAQKDFEGDLYKKIFDLVSKNQKLLKEAKPDVTKNSAGYYLWNVYPEPAHGERVESAEGSRPERAEGSDRIFDLNKLLVGSQGTLGIITEIKFKLIKPKKHSRMAVIFLKDLKPLVGVVQSVMKFNPESFESFDDHTLKIALRYVFGLIKLIGQNIFKLAWSFLPEFWMLVTGGIPKLILLAEFTDDSEENLQKKMEELAKELKSINANYRVLASEEEAKKYWTIRRESFNLLRHHIKGKRTAPFIDDFIVRVEKMPEFLPELNTILDQYDITYTIAGHAGDGNFHIIPLMDLSDPENHRIIKELSDKVYDLVLKYGGSITAEHNDGLIRSPYLEKMYGKEVHELFEETKKIFDPKNVFNPGKKVGSDLQYAFAHLVKESGA